MKGVISTGVAAKHFGDLSNVLPAFRLNVVYILKMIRLVFVPCLPLPSTESLYHSIACSNDRSVGV